MATARISLDNPVFAGRLRTRSQDSVAYKRRGVAWVQPRLVQDVRATHPGSKTPKVAKKQQATSGLAGVRLRTSVKFEPRTTKSSVLRRNIVQAPARKHKARLRLSTKLPLALAVLLFMFGVGVGLDGLRANKEVVAQVQSLQQHAAPTDTATAGDPNASSDNAATPGIPQEEKGPDVDSYRVAADLPRALYIPKLEVKARVLHVGTTRDGAIAAPSHILDTGWYKESSKPGQPGAMLIDGHVHGPTKPGIFVNLKKLKPGDEIQLERGDGTRLAYRVVESKTYPADNVDMGAALRPAEADKQGLNLITCTGQVDKATNQYKERLIVFAVEK